MREFKDSLTGKDDDDDEAQAQLEAQAAQPQPDPSVEPVEGEVAASRAPRRPADATAWRG
jgi:hypothetical protein